MRAGTISRGRAARRRDPRARETRSCRRTTGSIRWSVDLVVDRWSWLAPAARGDSNDSPKRVRVEIDRPVETQLAVDRSPHDVCLRAALARGGLAQVSSLVCGEVELFAH